MVPMLVIGGLAASFIFELDFLIGTAHYGMYLGFCLVGRLLAGIGLLPGMIKNPDAKPFVPPAASLLDNCDSLLCSLVNLLPF